MQATVLAALCLAAVLATPAAGHGQLTTPRARPDSQGNVESWEHRRPAFTLKTGNVFGASKTGYRCHDFKPESGAPKTVLKAGESTDLTWKMEAGHPGDCYVYLSYDADFEDPVNFFKILGVPGCGAPDGLNIPSVVTQKVSLPKELPACEHCVLRWEWTAHQQVDNIEYYVSCADVRIESSAPATRPEPMTAIAGIEHLPQDPEDYRSVYGGEGPEDKYLVGPAIATFSPCTEGSSGCIGGASTASPGDAAEGDNSSSEIAHEAAEPTGEAPAPSRTGTCSCEKSKDWDGDLGAFAGDKDFCSQNFGGPGPYISAGGGDGSNGGWSGDEPCSSGQYTFSESDGWQITVSKGQGEGKVPYRAFAYLQLCGGRPYSECLAGEETLSFSFSFKTKGAEEMGAYVKLLFWTDSGNLLGLLPPWHAKGDGKLRLVGFPADDFPNSWGEAVVVQDDTWYHVRFDFSPSGAKTSVSIWLDGKEFASGSIPVAMTDDSHGPQWGVYSFDLGRREWPRDGFKLWLDDACLGSSSGVCPSGGGAAPKAGGVPDSQPANESAPAPTAAQVAEHAAAPEQGDSGLGGGAGGALEPARTPTASCCSARLEQCGGEGWEGPDCCRAGSTCVARNQSYFHCVQSSEVKPEDDVLDDPVPALPSGEEEGSQVENGTADGQLGACAKAGEGCGGEGWTGTTCCEVGNTCLELGGGYSQCVPSSGLQAASFPSSLLQSDGRASSWSIQQSEACLAAASARKEARKHAQNRPRRQRRSRVHGFLAPESVLAQALAKLSMAEGAGSGHEGVERQAVEL